MLTIYTKKELKKHATKSKNNQVIEQVDEQLTEQALNKHQTSSKHVPYINIINNTNSINLDKQEISKNEKKINFTNSIFDEVVETDLKEEKKLREKKKKVEISKATPSFEETQFYFLEKNFPEIEAQRFFNYFESNGWLVGGRTKMKDWKAAARNWMLNAKKFSKNENSNSALSVRAEACPDRSGSRTINLNPNHLHVTNQKNYGEAL